MRIVSLELPTIQQFRDNLMSSSTQSTPNRSPSRRGSQKSNGKRRIHVPSIPTATAQLLTSTKALLQALTLWAVKTATVSDVSSKFVKFGDDFKALRKSYSASGLEISDIPDIPSILRHILEESLILEPSQETLDAFLPKIGEAVAKLMKILKDKQNDLSQVDSKLSSGKDRSVSMPNPSRISNSADVTSSESIPLISPSTSTSSTPTDTNFKDPIMRLQNNHGLMRRASKRFSAYQTSKILSMHSPRSELGKEFTPENLPKSPLQLEVSKNLKQSEIHQQLVTPPHAHKEIPLHLLDAKEMAIVDEEKDEIRQAEIEKADQMVDVDSILPNKPKNINCRLFLKLGNQVKKVNIRLPTSVANIKVLFTQKFGYSPSGSSPYPQIYIQDNPQSVAYELEKVEELEPDCIVSLYQPDLQTAIAKHVDVQIDSVKDDMIKMQDMILKKMEQMKSLSLSSPSTPIARVSDEAAFENNLKQKREQSNTNHKLVEDLKFEVARLKQHQIRTNKRLTDAVNSALEIVQNFQTVGVSAQDMANNPYMEHCRNKVSSECEQLVTQLDNLQDVIEALKLDISKRGSKPTTKQIQHLTKEMKSAKIGLDTLSKFMTTERKNWSNMWAAELNAIVSDQQFFKTQDEIINLLDEDYSAAAETFDLILKCNEQFEKGAPVFRPKIPIPDLGVSIEDARTLLLTEVQNLEPDHEQRLEAIRKAEKVRNIEKELLAENKFEDELDDFVGNDKLKKSGGIDEIERRRREKDEANLKNTFGVF